VEQQVGGFAEQRVVVLHHPSQRGFHALLAHLLRDAAHTALEQRVV
jgi:capsule polysaccharide modification protein KpsS